MNAMMNDCDERLQQPASGKTEVLCKSKDFATIFLLITTFFSATLSATNQQRQREKLRRALQNL
jgi:hypothetical protein